VSPFWASLLVWGLGWGGAFLVLELWAVTEWPYPPPWNTLSWTVWQLAARSAVLAMVIAGAMFVLLLHFVLPGHWPRRSTRAKVDEREGRR
jgi:hypothetical protein